MNNLKKFSTEAEYGSATLNYPAVSWVTGTDTVHFDKTAPVVANNKVKIAFTTDACCEGKRMNLIPHLEVVYSIDSLTVNGEPLTPGGSETMLELTNNTDYLIEYELKDGVSNVDDWFAITPAEGCSSTLIKYDILFPAQVTTIGGLNQDGFNNLILEETTPPSFTLTSSYFPSTYVPDSVLNTYKSEWNIISSSIHPISEYSGNIPT